MYVWKMFHVQQQKTHNRGSWVLWVCVGGVDYSGMVYSFIVLVTVTVPSAANANANDKEKILVGDVPAVIIRVVTTCPP